MKPRNPIPCMVGIASAAKAKKIKIFPRGTLPSATAAEMKRTAELGFSDGSQRSSAYMVACSAYDERTGACLAFTRDTLGNHGPARSIHLAISFASVLTQEPTKYDPESGMEWLVAFFGKDNIEKLHGVRRFYTVPGVNAETGLPEVGKIEIWHYRLYVDQLGRPIPTPASEKEEWLKTHVLRVRYSDRPDPVEVEVMLEEAPYGGAYEKEEWENFEQPSWGHTESGWGHLDDETVISIEAEACNVWPE